MVTAQLAAPIGNVTLVLRSLGICLAILRAGIFTMPCFSAPHFAHGIEYDSAMNGRGHSSSRNSSLFIQPDIATLKLRCSRGSYFIESLRSRARKARTYGVR